MLHSMADFDSSCDEKWRLIRSNVIRICGFKPNIITDGKSKSILSIMNPFTEMSNRLFFNMETTSSLVYSLYWILNTYFDQIDISG